MVDFHLKQCGQHVITLQLRSLLMACRTHASQTIYKQLQTPQSLGPETVEEIVKSLGPKFTGSWSSTSAYIIYIYVHICLICIDMCSRPCTHALRTCRGLLSMYPLRKHINASHTPCTRKHTADLVQEFGPVFTAELVAAFGADMTHVIVRHVGSPLTGVLRVSCVCSLCVLLVFDVCVMRLCT